MSSEIRSLEVRPAEVSDAVAACTVLRRSIAECCVEDHRQDPAILAAWLGNKTPEMVASWFASPTNYSVVAVQDGVVVGVGSWACVVSGMDIARTVTTKTISSKIIILFISLQGVR